MDNLSFKAMVVTEVGDKQFVREVKQRHIEDLPAGDVLINVQYSSLNYKDALSASGNKGVTKKYPHTPGIDAAGVVEESSSPNPKFKSGEQVIVFRFSKTFTLSDFKIKFLPTMHNWGRVNLLDPQKDTILELLFGGNADMA